MQQNWMVFNLAVSKGSYPSALWAQITISGTDEKYPDNVNVGWSAMSGKSCIYLVWGGLSLVHGNIAGSSIRPRNARSGH